MFLADIKKICKHRELRYFVNQKISKIVIKSMEFASLYEFRVLAVIYWFIYMFFKDKGRG
jgi:hypothetical protein